MAYLTRKEHKRLSAVARKMEAADLCLKGGTVVDCINGTLQEWDIAIACGRIAAVGHGFQAKNVMDCTGKVISPGFIDAHIHIESTMLCPRQFARAVVPRGTTCVIADPHEIANCLGTDGVRFMISQASDLPMDIFYSAPSCVPATHLETSGAELGPEEVEELLNMEGVIALGEMMNFPGVVFGDEEVHKKLEIARRLGVVIDGHAPGLSGEMLCAYVSAGIDSDHECTTPQEAAEKLERGMFLFLRQGTSEQNLKDLLPAVRPSNLHRCCLVSDDRDPDDLMDKGHMDYSLRVAVHSGLDPLAAVSMATINPATRFCLKDRGAICPGYVADLVILKDLKDFFVEATLFRGQIVAKDGQLVSNICHRALERDMRSMAVDMDKIDFSIKTKGELVRVIGIKPGQIVTDELIEPVRDKDGLAVSAPDRDIVKLAIIERHHGTGNIGLGFVKGLGLKEGAIASTIAHDSHNIIVAGVNDSDMLVAVSALVECGGGLSVARENRLVARLEMPIAGLMSDRPLEEVRAGLDNVKRATRDIGCGMDNPFMILSFLALPVIPKLKLTDKGLVDVESFSFVPLFYTKNMEK